MFGLEKGLNSNEVCESVSVCVFCSDKLKVAKEKVDSVIDGEGKKNPELNEALKYAGHGIFCKD